MTIKEIQNKYPEKKYYRLKIAPNNRSMFIMEKLEDFFELVDLVGYVESEVDGIEASEANLEMLVVSYLSSFYPYNPYISMRDPRVEIFLNYVNENMSNTLQLIIQAESYTTTNLFGINTDIMFEDTKSSMPEDKFEQGMTEVGKLYEKYKEGLDKNKKTRENDIRNCILNYKEKYLQLQSKADKEELIKVVQLELKEKFGISGRNDSRVSKIAIKKMYEGE